MPDSRRNKVLVLLIGEVLEDPRVLKTCQSLRDSGAEVTVACTDPSGRVEQETYEGLEIVRFPHRKEFIVKKLYNCLQGILRPGAGSALARVHEEVPSSPLVARLRNTVLSLNYRHHMRQNRAICRRMEQWFRSGSFALVHANDVDTLPAGAALKRCGAATELLYDSHEFWPGIGVHGSAPNVALEKLEHRWIRFADHVVTVNPVIAEKLCEIHNLPHVPAVVMNCPYLQPLPEGIGEPHTPVRVLYQGKLQAFRGLEMLVLAFRELDSMTLTLSGYGPLENRLKLLAKSEGLDDRIRFIGRYSPDETFTHIAGHDIGILPFDPVTRNILYTSPNKLFDYAMGGLAIASSDLPFMRSIIGEYDIGTVFSGISPGSIASVLREMAADAGALKRYRLNARRMVEENFYWDRQFAENYPWKPV